MLEYLERLFTIVIEYSILALDIVGAVFMQSFCSSRGDSAGEY